MYDRCLTAWSVPHFIFGAAFYSVLTWLPQWQSFKYVSFAITLVVAAGWEILELLLESYALRQRSWGWVFVDVGGKGESLCNMISDTILALMAHGILQCATDSREMLSVSIVVSLWAALALSNIVVAIIKYDIWKKQQKEQNGKK